MVSAYNIPAPKRPPSRTRPGPVVVERSSGTTIINRFPFPLFRPPKRPARRRVLNSTSDNASKKQLTVTAESGAIPVIYGRDRVGAHITDVLVHNNKLVLMCVWGLGPCEQIVQVNLGDEEFTGTVRHYLGANAEGVDATLSAARSLYTENPTDICFSVLEVSGVVDSLDVTAVVRGRNDIRDPRLNGGAGGDAYTSNSALIAGHFLSDFYGVTVDNTTLGAAANDSDIAVATLIGDEVSDRGNYKHRSNLAIYTPQSKERHLQTLLEYANCFLAFEGATAKLFPDVDGVSVATVTEKNLLEDSAIKDLAGSSQVPNMVTVQYTHVNANNEKWTDASYSTPAPSGTIRESRVRMPGITSLSQAKRFAIERLNAFTLLLLSGSYRTRDEGLAYLTGDIITLTDTEGMAAKKVRVLEARPTAVKGEWLIRWLEHDPLKYSASIETEPTFADSNLPNPNTIPTGPTISSVDNVNFTDETGRTYTRFRIKFSGSAFQFTSSYRVKVANGTDIILETTIVHRGSGVEHIAVTGPISQDVFYTIEVFIVNVFGVVGTTPGTTTKKGDGKTIPPTDVANLQGREAGQFVALSHDAAADTDLRGYEYRRLTATLYEANPSAGWAHASTVVIVDRHDSTVFLTPTQPVGVFYYMAKAHDKSGNVSLNHAATRVAVTSDYAGAVAIQSLNEATLVNMHKFTLRGILGASYVTTSGGESFSNKFSSGRAFNTVYSAGERWIADERVASSVVSAEWDTGGDRNGNWLWSASVVAFQGTIVYTVSVALAADHPTFTNFGGQSTNAAGRYFKAKAEVARGRGNGFQLKLPVQATQQGRILEQIIQSSVTATQPLVVVYPTAYAAAPEITPRYIGPNPLFAVADSITTTQFNLHLWDQNGVAVAGTVRSTCLGT